MNGEILTDIGLSLPGDNLLYIKQSIMQQQTEEVNVLTPDNLLQHWQGHRKLTRKLIEAFPEEALFTCSIGGMRPFANLVMEMIGLARGGMIGVVTGKWPNLDELEYHGPDRLPLDKEELLQKWDALTEHIDSLWARIRPERFEETDKAYGLYEGRISDLMLYWVDNEIHHRGQGYVYLRSLGIEPPPFWDRY